MTVQEQRREALAAYRRGERCARKRPAGPEHPWRKYWDEDRAQRPEPDEVEVLRIAHRRAKARLALREART